MKRSLKARLRLVLLLLLSLATAGGWAPAGVWAATSQQVQEVRQLLETYHLSKPDDALLQSDDIDDMVRALNDPYTDYFDEDEWAAFQDVLEQKFTGIGIVMAEEDGVVYIDDVIPGSPADTAGMQPGDAIVSADGKSVKGKSLEQLQTQLRGEEGTSVSLGLRRGDRTLTFYVTRKEIQVPVASGQLMGENIGYLSLSSFSSDAGRTFKTQLEKLEKRGIKALIIDLRDNGGGYVAAAQQIGELFVADGVLANLKDRNDVNTSIPLNGTARTYPITILVNGGTASASELLSGALQDYGLARLVGTQTYGKGVTQQLIPVASGGVLKVTVQEYFTPNGRKVDKAGLTPDEVVEGAAEQLIEAYRASGGKKLTLFTDAGDVRINGVRMPRSEPALQRGKAWYVNLRLAAALVGAEIGYDAKSRTVTVTADGDVHRLAAGDSRLVNLHGFNLIDVRALQDWFPALQADTIAGNHLQLTLPSITT